MVPAFVPAGGLPLTLCRGGFVAALLSAFGNIVFAAWVGPRAFARVDPAVSVRCRHQLGKLALFELVSATALLGCWVVLQAGAIAGVAGVGAVARAIGPVLKHTQFGQRSVMQALLLVAAGLALHGVPRPSTRAALVLAGGAVCLQACHGHAWAMHEGPSLLLLSEVVHLLAAGAWLGGLTALLLVVRVAPPRTAAAAARWFSPLGQWCIGAIAASSAFQAWHLIGSLTGLTGTAYGWTALLKLALFGGLFGLAVLNRYGLAPALLGVRAETAQRRLCCSIVIQIGIGIAIVTAAAILSSLPPAMHGHME